MLEKNIQKSILDWLGYRGDIYFFRAGSGQFKTDTGSYFKTGRPGCPDIIVCFKGKFIGFEVKTDKGKQSDRQKDAEEDIKNAGGRYYIVRSIDDVEKIIK